MDYSIPRTHIYYFLIDPCNRGLTLTSNSAVLHATPQTRGKKTAGAKYPSDDIALWATDLAKCAHRSNNQTPDSHDYHVWSQALSFFIQSTIHTRYHSTKFFL